LFAQTNRHNVPSTL